MLLERLRDDHVLNFFGTRQRIQTEYDRLQGQLGGPDPDAEDFRAPPPPTELDEDDLDHACDDDGLV
jgi:hypothetical protein